jgi:hypothetical protein
MRVCLLFLWRNTLRVALLTVLEPVAPGSYLPRGFLRIGGMSVARQQLGLALALGCERVICLAPGLSAELQELQQATESAGVQFTMITAPRQLLGLITAVDDLIVIGDGLFVSTADAAAMLEQGAGVLVQPIEQGLAAGFERIDLNHAAAALMRIPGRLVERIAELPEDYDPVSALQRIALQAGVPQRLILAVAGEPLFWTLVRSEADAHALEPQWIRQRTRADVSYSPARGIALLAVRLVGPALLHAGSGAGVITIAATILALIAVSLGWLGYGAMALACCALGWTLREFAAFLTRIEGDLPGVSRVIDGRAVYGWALDGVMIALSGWNMTPLVGQSPLDRYFPAAALIGVMRLLPRALAGRWTAALQDRAALALLLLAATAAGASGLAIQLTAILLLVAGIVLPRGEVILTQP